jgi:transposase-like protein
MRIQVKLPRVEPDVYEMPETCPYGCGSQHYKPHGVQGEEKPLRDPQYRAVQSHRYRCVRCGRSFRVYPRGVGAGPQSERLKGMTVLLYVLGLSYGAVEDFTMALGCGVGKTTVYNNVQAAGEQARKKQRQTVQQGGKRTVIGADGTYVRLKGKHTGIEVVVDDASGELLGLEIIVSESHDEIIDVIRRVAEDVDAEVLVSDDHGAYQEVVDDTGLAHQLCRHHVRENVEDLADDLSMQLEHNESAPEDSDLTPEQLETDLEQMRKLVRERPADGEQQLEKLYDRYKGVPQPPPGTRHSVWYRMRMLVTRLWERWRKFTLDQQRGDLDGTNNACERLIGWWIKERYRLMRGYKREDSIKNVVTLTARMGVRSGHYDMTELFV